MTILIDIGIVIVIGFQVFDSKADCDYDRDTDIEVNR